jgi:uncharacterized membrane protein
MACKGFGIALKLTFSGSNQFAYGSTYFFILTSLSCILVQLNYFNKALDIFSTAVVTPIYYVFFTTATIVASILLFGNHSSDGTHDLVSAMTGFAVIFIGVYLLSKDKKDAYEPTAAEIGKGRTRINSVDSLEQSLNIRKTSSLVPFYDLTVESLGLKEATEGNKE